MDEIAIERDGNAVVVAPKGDVVSSAAGEIRTALRDLVRSGVREMVFDLGNTIVIDSTGLGLLLSAYNSMTAVGGTFSVIHASDDIVDLCRSMRIHQHFAVSGR